MEMTSPEAWGLPHIYPESEFGKLGVPDSLPGERGRGTPMPGGGALTSRRILVRAGFSAVFYPPPNLDAVAAPGFRGKLKPEAEGS